jgi:hypothetical protein
MENEVVMTHITMPPKERLIKLASHNLSRAVAEHRDDGPNTMSDKLSAQAEGYLDALADTSEPYPFAEILPVEDRSLEIAATVVLICSTFALIILIAW